MISNQRSHFIINFSPMPKKHIKCKIGQISIKCQGTIRWKIEDDEGKVKILYIKDALYVPESLLSILRHHHWAQ